MLLISKYAWFGALLALGVLAGAILMHFAFLGIEVNNDNGLLFRTASITFALSAIVLYIYRADIPVIGKKLGA